MMIGGYTISYLAPEYLWLCLCLPVFWYISFTRLAQLGLFRRILAIGIRTIVVTFFILALAEVQLVKATQKVSVIYLLDQSLSIPPATRSQMVSYVNKSIIEHRDKKREDRAGVIVFGERASIEIPPFDDDVQVTTTTVQGNIGQDYTNLGGAIKLAMASFPEDASRRIVILSDGNENIGTAITQARSAIDSGIGIDVVPITYPSFAGEVLVEKVSVPAEIRKGETFDLRVVVQNNSRDGSPTKGRLRFYRKTKGAPELLNPDSDKQLVELAPGKNYFRIPITLDTIDSYAFEAEFITLDPDKDRLVQNNKATGFTFSSDVANVLLIQDSEVNPGLDGDEFDEQVVSFVQLKKILEEEKMKVQLMDASDLFKDAAELQNYDCVILADIPRDRFTDDQISQLVANTQNMGSGLIMLGGSKSFGAGGWASTKMEEAMPVDFRIKSAKIIPKGALALLMHASEMPKGNFWQHQIGKLAINALGHEDLAALVHWDWNKGDQFLWGAPSGFWKVGKFKKVMLSKLSKLQPGDMPHFEPSMKMVAKSFANLKATQNVSVMHMMIISDGDPGVPSNATINSLKASGVTVTTVGVGTHGPPNQNVLRKIARATGGKFYNVTNPKTLPQIYQREVRRISQPLVFEKPEGIPVKVQESTKFVKDMSAGIPDITGYVRTTVKDNPLVEVSLATEVPSGTKSGTILAHWKFGLGTAAVLTTDVGQKWATNWVDDAELRKMLVNVVRVSLRPSGDTENITLTTDIKEGKMKIMMSVLDDNKKFINGLSPTAIVTSPDMKGTQVKLEQVAPGRYEKTVDATESGSYFVAVSPGHKSVLLRTGGSVPYSPEFRDQEPNENMLKQIAKIQGNPGQLDYLDPSVKHINPFRDDLRKATSSQDIWHWFLVIACSLFFIDVFNRRVSLGTGWLREKFDLLYAKLRSTPEQENEDYMERLRGKKDEINKELEQQKAAVRFEVSEDADTSAAVRDESKYQAPAQPIAKKPAAKKEEQDQESYTDRLLKAKKKVRRDKNL